MPIWNEDPLTFQGVVDAAATAIAAADLPSATDVHDIVTTVLSEQAVPASGSLNTAIERPGNGPFFDDNLQPPWEFMPGVPGMTAVCYGLILSVDGATRVRVVEAGGNKLSAPHWFLDKSSGHLTAGPRAQYRSQPDGGLALDVESPSQLYATWWGEYVPNP